MILSESELKQLIDLNIEKAFQATTEVAILIENHLYATAVNRIYYGIFYIISALALKNNFSTSNHSQLIGWFNKTYIKNNIVDRNIGKKIHHAFKQRIEGDYNVLIQFSLEDVEDGLKDMKDIIESIHELIKKS
ncbi:MAG: HEPN domain-containing protein [Candidatus Cloacimonadales bacterium]|nr:HEPN domain-containing protein [Candidatus Cloacimonadales bacterium]